MYAASVTVRSTSAAGSDIKAAALSTGKNDVTTSVTTNDGAEIFYKDWGRAGQPIVFHHGWPLSADDWDAQMMFFLSKAIASSRMTGAAMAARPRPATATRWTLCRRCRGARRALDLRTPSMSATRPAAARSRAMSRRHGQGRVAKAVLISAVPPLMVKTDGTRAACRWRCSTASAAARRQPGAVLHRRPAGPFYGFNRPGAKAQQGSSDNWWRQGMMGGAKAHYECIKAFSETDFTEDLKAIDVPALVHAWRRRPDRARRCFRPLPAKLLRAAR